MVLTYLHISFCPLTVYLEEDEEEDDEVDGNDDEEEDGGKEASLRMSVAASSNKSK